MTFFGYGALPLPADAGFGAGTGGELAERLGRLPHSQLMGLIAELGVQTTARTPVAGVTHVTIAQVQERVEEIAALRAELEFGIDGIVIKADAAQDQAEAGFSSRAPRWAIAYKLPAVERITRLVGVEWNVGRTGVIAPRAVLEPVKVDGSLITYATLHNAADIARRGLMIGDHVTVKKAGDVIPRVEAPVVGLRTGEETPIHIPQVCPGCGGPIDTDQQRWRCVQGRACQAAASVRYAVGRDQLDIEGLGDKLIDQLVAAGIVTDVADLFTLTRDQLLGLDRMGDISTDKLLAAIDAARAKPLNKVFCALGVRGTGRSMSRRIARHFATMDAIRAADADAFQEVDGVGPERAAMLVAEIADLAPVIDKLIAAGVTMTEPGAADPAAEPSDDSDSGDHLPLSGKSIVVTGSMTGRLAELSRNQMNELVERAGGRASSSVSARTSLVVAGDNAGSKKAKAEKLQVPIATPEEFAVLVSDFI
ncbi:hypothetical protein GCM10023195_74240 [Actinoallomurus liliacearum]|uniref:DNA ligase n=1 Tax=Actinoallomurus liliacearum TaxID=1080073 RepID=A0ABP8TUS0_9ACTN